jgi:N-glycosylase/DNA lyase
MEDRSDEVRSVQREQLALVYRMKRREISLRLEEFKDTWRIGDDRAIFAELVFCLLTPQSNALKCWQATRRLEEKGLTLTGSVDRVAGELSGVRFHNNKARYVVEARRLHVGRGAGSIRRRLDTLEDPFDRREWVVGNVKGLGYKEASHFLRNIGLGETFAILDRHILRHLLRLCVIEALPTCLSRARYLEIEEKMRELASQLEMPLDHLDLLLWYVETGTIFR